MKILKQNTLLKVLSLNSISVAVSFVLGIFSSKIISVFLGTSGMALMGSFRNFALMLKSVATLGISNSIVKLFVENKEDKKELSVIYSTFFWVFLIISSVMALLVLLFASPISSFLFFTDKYTSPIRFFGLLLPFMVINTFWLAIYNGLEKFKRIMIIQIISNVLVFGLTALLIWKENIFGGLLSIAIAEVLMVLVTFIFVRKHADYFKFDLQKLISKKYFNIIKRFSVMALLTAIIAPLTLLFIRNLIVEKYSIQEAGIWDAVNRLSSFYMIFFSSGLSLYYMPKLASIHTESEFKAELKSYFKVFVPLFLTMLVVIYIAKGIILKLAFTAEFSPVENILIWQLLGDFFRIMTLAFGFQILVKTMMKRYFLVEIVFNLMYFLLSFYLIKQSATEGVLQAYFYANLICFVLVLVMFRKLFFKPKDS
ncbi:O-antigen translocase [Flavobacterium sp. AS60]|uniref:O-antigen translocase n=1 Tax=Flavobacterium anseongense TaxID=2910677 RepID=UPI001F243CEE|nr:O-antigen translocase [Flavobacterium sp. AS60]MCF6130453.1 O-antigen translocase [Flavobacterium sp. AS60]